MAHPEVMSVCIYLIVICYVCSRASLEGFCCIFDFFSACYDYIIMMFDKTKRVHYKVHPCTCLTIDEVLHLCSCVIKESGPMLRICLNGNLITHVKSVVELDVNFICVVKVVAGVCVFSESIAPGH